MLIAVFAVFGLIFGSFLNAAIYRLASKESLAAGRSHCVHCSYQLKVLDLIPLVSFVILKGKCRSCRQAIPLDYFFVELIMALLFAYTGWLWLNSFEILSSLPAIFTLIRDLIVVCSLVFLFVYDAKYYLLPDVVTLPSIVIIVLLQFLLGVGFVNLLIGLAVGAGFFLLQYLLSKGKWIGGGDIRLGGLMGVILGWPTVLVALFLSYVIGAPVAIYMLISGKKKMKSEIPFGTFLVLGTFISFWWGKEILAWYLNFL